MAVLRKQEGKDILLVIYDHTVQPSKESIKAICSLHRQQIESQRIFSLDHIWAQSGYGPLMALIAMNESGVNGVAANFNGVMTDPALRVWKEFYEGEGNKWVTVNRFDHPIHDIEELNVYFTLDYVIPNLEEAKNRAVFRDDKAKRTFIRMCRMILDPVKRMLD